MGFWVKIVRLGHSFICSFARRCSLDQLLCTPDTSQLQPVVKKNSIGRRSTIKFESAHTEQWRLLGFNNEIPNEVLRLFQVEPLSQAATHSEL
jgi:hypothetical protein